MLIAADFTRAGATVSRDGTVEGYASLFGEIDQSRDMVMPGAFAASLRQRPVRRVPMLFQHDPAEPVGVWLELAEDTRGLYARGRLIPEVARARELFALLEAGTSDGLSIGFRTVRARTDPTSRVRRLEAVDLWEISIVTFPLLAGARLAPAGAADQRAASLRQAARPRAVKDGGSPSRPRPSARAPSQDAPALKRRAPHEAADPSARAFRPERLYRRSARFAFGAGERGLTWRDLVLPERALRAGA